MTRFPRSAMTANSAVLHASGERARHVASIKYAGEESLQLTDDLWDPDGGPAVLKRERTWDMFGCAGDAGSDAGAALGKGSGEIFALTDEDEAKGNLIPACSETNPCSLITYVEARAMHPRLFQWAGPFDTLLVHSADGKLRSSWSYGSYHGADGGFFNFKQTSDRELFAQVAQYLRDHKRRFGMFDRFERTDPGRAFGGLGVFRAVGAEDPGP